MNTKKIFPLLVVICLSLVFSTSSCKKDQEKVRGCTDPASLTYNSEAEEDDGTCLVPEQKQRATVINFTATWCSPCGSSGIPLFVESYTTHPNDVVPLKCNQSDEMSNTISEGLANDYNVTGIPHIVVANQNDVWGTTSINNAITTCNASAPIVNSCAIFSASGTALTVQTQTKFFSATSGDYYLATYLMESGLKYDQEGISTTPYTHNHVLRGIAKGGSHGELIASGTIASGNTINKTYTTTAGTGWNTANMYVATVLWKKVGSDWTYVNAWQSKAN